MWGYLAIAFFVQRSGGRTVHVFFGGGGNLFFKLASILALAA